MKKNTRKKVAVGVSLILLVGLVFGYNSIDKLGGQLGSYFGEKELAFAPYKPAESPADDLAGALEYEFNMTKDPQTGEIPEGIFEAEQAQANEIAELQRQQSFDKSLLRENRFAPEFASYSFIGPNNLGGRSRSVIYDVRHATNNTILACGVSGGVFKSTDDAATWTRKSPTGEHYSCTSLAQDPRAGQQDTWYYTVGENLGNSANASGAFYTGNGVYKSTDNGETWARLPASNTSPLESFSNAADLISKVVVDPTNGNVYIATLASIQRSTDGGASWATVLIGALANAGQITDVVVTSTGKLYAALPGNAGASMDGVHTSTTGDSGSWTKIAGTGSATTPAQWNAAGAYGRVVLAIAPSDENRVYALYYRNFVSSCTGTPAPEAEFFFWNQATTTWTDISTEAAHTLPDEPGCSNGNDPFAVQGGYDLVVAVKPDDADTIFIGGTNAYRSTDTGATWTRIGGYVSPTSYGLYPNHHPDLHYFAFQPGTPTTMLTGDDGGLHRTADNLAANVAWTLINTGFRTYQYYYVVNDPRTGNSKVMGGAQDNGTTRNIGGTGSNFESVFGGDGVSVGLSDPAASGGIQYEYVGSQLGSIVRRNSTSGANFGTSITPTGEAGTGLFVTLFTLDPDNTQTLYYANDNFIYRTASASTVTSSTWTQMTGIGTAVGTAFDVSAIGLTRGAYNAATSSLFFGTSNGRVFRLDDPLNVAAATAPVEITPAGSSGYVSSITASPVNDDEVIVTYSNYGVPSVFYTANANAAAPTWTNVEGNIALPSHRSSAVVNTGAQLEFYVGTSAGLYSITGLPGNTTWVKESVNGIGNAVITDLDLRTADNKLLVGTHGYGMWAALAPTAASATVSGQVATNFGRGISRAIVEITDQNGTKRTAMTNQFGYYNFSDVEVGGTYIINARHKRYKFNSQTISVNESLANVNLIAGNAGVFGSLR